MQPDLLILGRKAARLTQQQAAEKLGVSQAYLAMMEGGRRRVTPALAKKAAKLYRLSPAALPIEGDAIDGWDSDKVARSLANLGYPGFRYLGLARTMNPAIVLLAALAASELEVRVMEALPWLVAHHSNLDWEWVIREAKLRDLQNRLGFIVTLGRRFAEKQFGEAGGRGLRLVEEILSHSRLLREDTLGQPALTDAERQWLRRFRPPDAEYWNLLTDLEFAQLPYAA